MTGNVVVSLKFKKALLVLIAMILRLEARDPNLMLIGMRVNRVLMRGTNKICTNNMDPFI